ncbi:MAG: DNA-3-methyladenine glycosylase 2 family protein [Candidatus Paceibacterota bacterium]
MQNPLPIDPKAALRHFKKSDERMATLLTSALATPAPIELPKPKKPDEFFTSIVRSIVSQQISVKAAASVYGRVEALLGTVTAENVNRADEDELRACGLSGQKTRYIVHNASIWHEVPTTSFSDMSDEEVITELTKLYGIGRWTAEMFLMFSLARPDIFSFGDLGLMQGLYQNYGYKKHWRRKVLQTVEAWSPHRTIASLVLWHQKDNEPVVY